MENYLNENFGDVKGKNSPEEAIQFNPKGIFRFNPIRRPFQVLTLAAEAIRRPVQVLTLAAEAIRRPIQVLTLAAAAAAEAIRPFIQVLTLAAEAIRPSTQDTTEKYKLGKILGSGTFGDVLLVENKRTTKIFAMKRIQRGAVINDYVAREIKNLKSLCHPNVIQFKEVVLSSTHLGIVMEYAEGGDLYDKISWNGSKRRFTENTARYYFQQLISGVSYLHSKDICHRDLKPENILLDGSNPPCLKICDFGFSKSGRLHSKPKSAVGTPQYWAPEICSGVYDGKLADVWSCGVTLYNMLVGVDLEYDTWETSNGKNGCPFSPPDFLSADCKDLLYRIFVKNPKERISIEEIKKHRWFKKKLKGKLVEASQVTKENSRFSLQSDEEIDIIVEEAKIPPPEHANGTEVDVEFEEEEEDEDSSCGVDQPV